MAAIAYMNGVGGQRASDRAPSAQPVLSGSDHVPTSHIAALDRIAMPAASGGQRRRLALARALVHRPAIVILDEATSALDSATEARVYENLRSLDVTKIVIAHRVTTIATPT